MDCHLQCNIFDRSKMQNAESRKQNAECRIVVFCNLQNDFTFFKTLLCRAKKHSNFKRAGVFQDSLPQDVSQKSKHSNRGISSIKITKRFHIDGFPFRLYKHCFWLEWIDLPATHSQKTLNKTKKAKRKGNVGSNVVQLSQTLFLPYDISWHFPFYPKSRVNLPS